MLRPISHPCSGFFEDDRNVDDFLYATQDLLKAGKETLSAAPVPPGLPAALNVLEEVLDRVKLTRSNRAAVDSLCIGIRELCSRICAVKDTVSQRTGNVAVGYRAQVQTAVEESEWGLSGRIQTLRSELDKVAYRARGLAEGSRFRRWWRSRKDAEVLKELRTIVEDACKHFILEGHITVEALVHRVFNDVEILLAAEEQRTLSMLLYADAGYRAAENESKGCFLEGTRTEVFQRLQRWEDRSEHRPVCILVGGAGMGKSTIASEFCRRLNARERLGASFFFSRDTGGLDSTSLFFATIAHQLAQSQAQLRPHLIEAIRNCMKSDKTLQMQYAIEGLIREPLRKLDESHPPIFVVVDALDECTNPRPTNPDFRRTADLLRHLLSCVEERRSHLRVLVTSRPGLQPIDSVFSEFEHCAETLSLDNISLPSVNRDIEAFIRNKLRFASRSQGPERYEHAVSELTTRAAGLFAYANTVVEFLLEDVDELDIRLEVLLSKPNAGNPLHRLDQLYLTVLRIAFPLRWRVRHAHMKPVLGFIVAIQGDGISPATLEELTLFNSHHSVAILNKLRSVVHFERDNRNAKFRPMHVTFRDFLVDSPCAAAYKVDVGSVHTLLAISCIERIIQFVEGRMSLLPTVPAYMEYATTYWTIHKNNASGSRELEELIRSERWKKAWKTWKEARPQKFKWMPWGGDGGWDDSPPPSPPSAQCRPPGGSQSVTASDANQDVLFVRAISPSAEILQPQLPDSDAQPEKQRSDPEPLQQLVTVSKRDPNAKNFQSESEYPFPWQATGLEELYLAEPPLGESPVEEHSSSVPVHVRQWIPTPMTPADIARAAVPGIPLRRRTDSKGGYTWEEYSGDSD